MVRIRVRIKASVMLNYRTCGLQNGHIMSTQCIQV